MSESGKVWFETIDSQGRVQLPPELRRRLALHPGVEIALVLFGRSVYIHSVPADEPVSEGSVLSLT